MRLWDVPEQELCRKHLLGMHFELHVMWNALRGIHSGWRNHPETKRWEDHMPALMLLHRRLVEEMRRRGYEHNSPLGYDHVDMRGSADKPQLITPLEEQRRILAGRDCACPLQV